MERNCYKSGTELLSKWHGFVIQVAQDCYPSGTEYPCNLLILSAMECP